MKKNYTKLTMQVVAMQSSNFICYSSYDVVSPDEPNIPAGARDFNDFDRNEEEEEKEDSY